MLARVANRIGRELHNRFALAGQKFNPDGTNHGQGSWFKIADSKNRGTKNNGGSWFNIAHNTTSGVGKNVRDELVRELSGIKMRDVDGYERSHPDAFGWKTPRTSSKSTARKGASALIAKIPEPLARHIARTFLPKDEAP